MSRLAKKPIVITQGAEVNFAGQTMTVKGPKGTMTRELPIGITGSVENGTVSLTPGRELNNQALLGTFVSHLKNMLHGVTTGYDRKLILEGIGFKSEVKGQNLALSLGFSHPVSMPIPKGLTVTAEKNLITVSGMDKELVGQFAASVRAMKKPEPYKGKGFRYDDEVIKRKEGKKTA
jgi:large subunit ribosomal protein L6